MSDPVRDWTQGSEGIAYQACPACAAVWYFRRTFCPRCGDTRPQTRQAAGTGTLHAISVVARAPAEELRAYTPYAIALVDADEGFRLMAHAARDLRIGERVRARFVDFAGRPIPCFERA